MRPFATSKSRLAGLRQFWFRLFGGFCCGVFERGKNRGGSLLDDFQALGKQGCVAAVQVDVIRRWLERPNCLAMRVEKYRKADDAAE